MLRFTAFQKTKNVSGRNNEEKKTSPAGNRTPVSRVTGGDTHHYTTEESVLNVLMF